MLQENNIATKVLDCAFTVHRNLGPGLLESAYQLALETEMIEYGLTFYSQYPVPLEYKGRSLETAYRLDFLISNKIIVELKSVDSIHDVHLAQVLTYLKLTECKLGLLLNFNVKMMKQGIRRVVL